MDFNKLIEIAKHDFIKIEVTNENIRKITKFLEKLLPAKINEHGKDNKHEYKRFYTGILGEVAIEQFLNIEFIDWTVGKSSLYSRPDLEKVGLNIGIKTVEYGKFPLIHKRSTKPEIINIKTSDKTILICGYATKKVLNKFQDDKMVLSPNVDKSIKTCFYGFHKLKKFNNLFDLKHIPSLYFNS
jgi:hypothetical protein